LHVNDLCPKWSIALYADLASSRTSFDGHGAEDQVGVVLQRPGAVFFETSNVGVRLVIIKGARRERRSIGSTLERTSWRMG
jgi:hypothetical protein